MYISNKITNIKINRSLSLRELLIEYKENNNLTALSLSSILSIDRKAVKDILDGNGDIKMLYAIRVMNLLNISDSDFISAYMNELNEIEQNIIQQARKVSYIIENFELETLKHVGILKKRIRLEDVEHALCEFFCFESIYEYSDTQLYPTLFSKSKMNVAQDKESKMQRFWLKCAGETFTRINNQNEYNEDFLLEFLKRIRPFTKDVENGFRKVVYALYQIGITVLVQPYMEKTKAFGGSMVINDKPCIIITDMQKKYHKLWLTLLHELYHIVHDYEYIRDFNYHISDSEMHSLFICEEDADKFACDILLPTKASEVTAMIISSSYKVNEIASKINVHPSIVYGVYLETLSNDSKVKSHEYAKYAKYLISTEKTIKDIVFDIAKEQNIQISIERIKQEYNKKII